MYKSTTAPAWGALRPRSRVPPSTSACPATTALPMNAHIHSALLSSLVAGARLAPIIKALSLLAMMMRWKSGRQRRMASCYPHTPGVGGRSGGSWRGRRGPPIAVGGKRPRAAAVALASPGARAVAPACSLAVQDERAGRKHAARHQRPRVGHGQRHELAPLWHVCALGEVVIPVLLNRVKDLPVEDQRGPARTVINVIVGTNGQGWVEDEAAQRAQGSSRRSKSAAVRCPTGVSRAAQGRQYKPGPEPRTASARHIPTHQTGQRALASSRSTPASASSKYVRARFIWKCINSRQRSSTFPLPGEWCRPFMTCVPDDGAQVRVRWSAIIANSPQAACTTELQHACMPRCQDGALLRFPRGVACPPAAAHNPKKGAAGARGPAPRSLTSFSEILNCSSSSMGR